MHRSRNEEYLGAPVREIRQRGLKRKVPLLMSCGPVAAFEQRLGSTLGSRTSPGRSLAELEETLEISFSPLMSGLAQ